VNTLTVGGFSRACIAVLSAAVTLTACGSHEEQQSTPLMTRQLPASPGTDRWAEWGSNTPTDAAGKVYMGICLMDLRIPSENAQKVQNFDAVTLVGDRVVGIITGTAGAMPNSGRFGLTITPKGGGGVETFKFNLDTLEANQVLADEGICPA